MRYSILWDYTSAKLQKDVTVQDLICAIEKNIFHGQLMEKGDFYISFDPNEKLDKFFQSQLEEAGFHITSSAMLSTDNVAHDFLINYQQKHDNIQLVLFSNRLDRLPLVYAFLTTNSHKCHVICSLQNNIDPNLDDKSSQADDLIKKNDLRTKLDDKVMGEGKLLSHCEPKDIFSIHKNFIKMNSSSESYLCMIKFHCGKENDVPDCLKIQLAAFESNLMFLRNGVGLLEFFSEKDSRNARESFERLDPSLRLRATSIDASSYQQEYVNLPKILYDKNEANEFYSESVNSDSGLYDDRYSLSITSDYSRVNGQKSQKFFILLDFKGNTTKAHYLLKIHKRLKGIKAKPIYIDPDFDWGVVGLRSENDRKMALARLKLERNLVGLAFNPEPVDMLPKYFSQRMEFVNRRNDSKFPQIFSFLSEIKVSSPSPTKMEKKVEEASPKFSYFQMFWMFFVIYFVTNYVVSNLVTQLEKL